MIRLEKMTEELFRPTMQESIVAYAKEHVRTGNWVGEGSEERAKREFERLLPQGIETRGQHVMSIVEETSNMPVGSSLVYGTKRRESPVDLHLRVAGLRAASTQGIRNRCDEGTRGSHAPRAWDTEDCPPYVRAQPRGTKRVRASGLSDDQHHDGQEHRLSVRALPRRAP